MSILKVIVYHQGTEIGRCSSTQLIKEASTSARHFVFKSIEISKSTVVNNSGHSYINFTIYYENAKNQTVELNKFKIIPLEEVCFDCNGDVAVYGHLIPDWGTSNYEQDLIDIFSTWGEMSAEDWTLTAFSKEKKRALLEAKAAYYSYPNISNVKRQIVLEGLNISDFYDFYLELGDKALVQSGYFGSSYSSLVDCLMELFKEQKDDMSIQITFKNYQHISTVCGVEYLEDVVKLFETYNFIVVKA